MREFHDDGKIYFHKPNIFRLRPVSGAGIVGAFAVGRVPVSAIFWCQRGETANPLAEHLDCPIRDSTPDGAFCSFQCICSGVEWTRIEMSEGSQYALFEKFIP